MKRSNLLVALSTVVLAAVVVHESWSGTRVDDTEDLPERFAVGADRALVGLAR